MYAHVLSGLLVIVVKEGRTYLALAPSGEAAGWPHGVYRDDTRMFSGWSWRTEDAQVLAVQTRENVVQQHTAILDEKRYQHIGLERRLTVSDAGFIDSWTLTNTGGEPRRVELSLEVEGEFRDLFAVWGNSTADGERAVASTEEAGVLRLSRTASDGVQPGAEVRVETDGQPSATSPRTWAFDLSRADAAASRRRWRSRTARPSRRRPRFRSIPSGGRASTCGTSRRIVAAPSPAQWTICGCCCCPPRMAPIRRRACPGSRASSAGMR
jgi:hypothetical protein